MRLFEGTLWDVRLLMPIGLLRLVRLVNLVMSLILVRLVVHMRLLRLVRPVDLVMRAILSGSWGL